MNADDDYIPTLNGVLQILYQTTGVILLINNVVTLEKEREQGNQKKQTVR